MDMNSDNFMDSIRLLLSKDCINPDMALRLRDFLIENGIATVFIRSNCKTNDNIVTVAKLLKDNFKVFIECNVDGFRSLNKVLSHKMKDVELLPVFDIGDNIDEFREIVREPLLHNKAQHVYIKNDEKLMDKKGMKKTFDAITKETGLKNVKFYWDCGFVLCSFTEDQLGFFIQKGSEIIFSCPSVISIDTELKFRICEKLKGIAGNEGILSKTSCLANERNKFNIAVIPYQSFGIYRQCSNCPFLQKSCSGGCKAVIVKSFQSNT